MVHRSFNKFDIEPTIVFALFRITVLNEYDGTFVVIPCSVYVPVAFATGIC